MEKGPLTGMKVVECTTWAFGPLAGVMLGDLGAQVIKVENPQVPDAARGLTIVAGADVEMPDGTSALFDIMNRNKRSIALDVKSERGRELLKRLVAEADIFIQNFRPGVFKRLGLGYDDLAKINPKLIYASTSGYGQKGAEAERPALDAVGQARSGMYWASGEPGDPPNWISYGFADIMGASMLAHGILAAVAARERYGIGQEVEVSHLQASMWLEYWGIGTCLYKNLPEWPRFDRTVAANPLFSHYRCGDGEWLTLGMIDSDRDFAPLCRVMELEYLLDDPRFVDVQARAKNAAELVEILDLRFVMESRETWEKRLGQNPDLIYDRVQRVGDLPNDPAVLANGYLVDVDHPRYGRQKMVAPPANLSKTPGRIQCVAPELGEHTLEILRELGLHDEDVATLMAEGVVG